MATRARPTPAIDGPAILATLRDAGITARQLANVSNISYWHLSTILHGRTRPGYVATARLRAGMQTLNLAVPLIREEVARAC